MLLYKTLQIYKMLFNKQGKKYVFTKKALFAVDSGRFFDINVGRKKLSVKKDDGTFGDVQEMCYICAVTMREVSRWK